ncbi:MAG: sulfite exporter TauE/SafE family protein [Paracoccus sp. (in: a-proteobacteria)]|uniref:sulfite exporter TauE/SafE family protein n=1 Tax=Paracoccus sp. TaxID=267 RepID=UPI0026E01236|nr:sulfite exporter TauE/SafE family protein [Paracoccus sp. (in: a-proteobacteria)]MDO5632797.1 sulfite exporter TauE/SafE family protein [Paracoccus sp. (in: a-proteobacteria)]
MTITPELIAFWLIAAVAAWVQTQAGFALGLILMGAVGALGLMPVPQAAAVTSVLVVMHGVTVLLRGWRAADLRVLAALLIGALPGIVVGYVLLSWLAGSTVAGLQLLLGLVIAGSALQLAWRPGTIEQPTSPPVMTVTGFSGGILGGLFATSGPPVIWQLYRQPMALHTVRTTLLAFFFVTQVFRLGVVIASGGLTLPLLVTATGAAPAVLLGTWIARRFPPPVSPATIRKVALVLLFASGASMVITGLTRLL